MKPREFKKRSLELSRSDRRSLISLFILIVVVIFLPSLIEKIFGESDKENDLTLAEVKKLDSLHFWKDSTSDQNSSIQPNSGLRKSSNYINLLYQIHLPDSFRFNPNLADSQTWKNTGLKAYKIKIIRHYLQKGGHFRRKEDLKKIYSLDEEDYARLESHIYIPPRNQDYTIPDKREYDPKRKSPWHREKILSKKSKININLADFEEFKRNTSLNNREIWEILNFRKRNGPYSDIRELKNLRILDYPSFYKIQNQLSTQ